MVGSNAVKRAYGGRTDDERRARLSGVVIEVREQANRAEVRAECPRTERNINMIIDYTVSVPQNATVFRRTISGDVRAINVRGELNVEATSGDIQVTGARRLGQVKSVSGSSRSMTSRPMPTWR